MNISIIGPGAIGTMLAFKLSSAGANITLIVKPSHISLINKKEITLNLLKTQGTRIKVQTKIDKTDYIIITVKSYDFQKSMNDLINTQIPVMCCQNGLQTLNIAKQKLNGNKIDYLVTGHGISKKAPGQAEHKGYGFTYIGNISGNNNEKLIKIKNYLNDSGLITEIVNPIEDYIWLKSIINSAINPVAAANKVKNGVLANSDLNKIVKQLCEESTNVSKAMKIKLPLDPWIEINKIIDKTSENTCSMLQDIKNQKTTEIEAINGEIIRIGKQYNIPTPKNQEFLQKIQLISN